MGLKSSPHGLSMPGYTRVTKVKTTKYDRAIWSFLKNYLSPLLFLKLELIKVKSLVTVN